MTKTSKPEPKTPAPADTGAGDLAPAEFGAAAGDLAVSEAPGASLAGDEMTILGHAPRLTCLEGGALQFGLRVPVSRHYTTASGAELEALRDQLVAELEAKHGPESDVHLYPVELDVACLLSEIDKTGKVPAYIRRVDR